MPRPQERRSRSFPAQLRCSLPSGDVCELRLQPRTRVHVWWHAGVDVYLAGVWPRGIGRSAQGARASPKSQPGFGHRAQNMSGLAFWGYWCKISPPAALTPDQTLRPNPGKHLTPARALSSLWDAFPARAAARAPGATSIPAN